MSAVDLLVQSAIPTHHACVAHLLRYPFPALLGNEIGAGLFHHNA